MKVVITQVLGLGDIFLVICRSWYIFDAIFLVIGLADMFFLEKKTIVFVHAQF